MSKKNTYTIVRKFALSYLHFTALQFVQDSSEKMQDSTPIYATVFGVYILIKNILIKIHINIHTTKTAANEFASVFGDCFFLSRL